MTSDVRDVRGPKSAGLEGQIETTIARYGAGSALYLSGNELRDSSELPESYVIPKQLKPSARAAVASTPPWLYFCRTSGVSCGDQEGPQSSP